MKTKKLVSKSVTLSSDIRKGAGELSQENMRVMRTVQDKHKHPVKKVFCHNTLKLQEQFLPETYAFSLFPRKIRKPVLGLTQRKTKRCNNSEVLHKCTD